jgi:hypothetical protein
MPAEAASTTTRPRPRSKPAANIAAFAMGPTEEQVRQRAYEIYVARGARPGNPDWDWQQAELELRARLALLGKP